MLRFGHVELRVGAQEAQEVLEPGRLAAALEAELQLWADALADWRAQRFLACRNKLKTLRVQDANLFLYRLCDDRVASLIHTPPSSVWDGTTVIGEK